MYLYVYGAYYKYLLIVVFLSSHCKFKFILQKMIAEQIYIVTNFNSLTKTIYVTTLLLKS